MDRPRGAAAVAEQLSGSSFGELLRRLRADAGLTQEELAESAGLSARAISDLERGVNPTARRDTTRLLAEAFGLVGDARAMFESIARGRTAVKMATPPQVTLSALVGRDSEIGTLVGLVRDVAVGRGSSLLIEGEPGIGKSVLVGTALAKAADAECQVFWGAGDELGQSLPLLPLLERSAYASPRPIRDAAQSSD